MIDVRHIAFGSSEYQQAIDIRKIVFVEEQKVPEEDELDEFEEESHHYLAELDGKAVGAARWRNTPDYIKLERFAVLKECRGKKIGTALVARILEDLKDERAKGRLLKLHSQVDAIPLYAKFGFEEEGEIFDECGILHREMNLKP